MWRSQFSFADLVGAKSQLATSFFPHFNSIMLSMCSTYPSVKFSLLFFLSPFIFYVIIIYFLRHTGQRLLNSQVYNYNVAYLNNAGMDVMLFIWFCSHHSSLLHEKVPELNWLRQKKILSSWTQNVIRYRSWIKVSYEIYSPVHVVWEKWILQPHYACATLESSGVSYLTSSRSSEAAQWRREEDRVWTRPHNV